MRIQPFSTAAYSPTFRVASAPAAPTTGSSCSCGEGCNCSSVAKEEADSLELSAEARAAEEAARPQESSETPEESESVAGELSEEEQQQVEELKERDREVRAHEQAHLAAAGPHARGGPTFEYQQGPDGKRYAIGGEVQIDTSPIEGDPEATIRKAQVIRAAANAPAEPSSQDRSVAAAASQLEAQARSELTQQQQEKSGDAQSDSGRSADQPPGVLLDLVA